MALGFRQLAAERWAASPLYSFEIDARAQDILYRQGQKTVLKVTLKLNPKSKGQRFEIGRVEASEGGVSKRAVKLKLNTTLNLFGLSGDGYWLDSGSVISERCLG